MNKKIFVILFLVFSMSILYAQKTIKMLKAGPKQEKEVLVAVGYNRFLKNSNYCGAIYYSENQGQDWEIVWQTKVKDFIVRKVEYIEELNQFVALGSYDPGGYYKDIGHCLIFYSYNGKDWLKSEPDFYFDDIKVNYSPKDLAYGNGVLVGVAPGSNIVYTFDGENWHHILENEPATEYRKKLNSWYKKSHSHKRHPYNHVNFVNGRFLVTGQAHQALYLKLKDGKLVIDEVVDNKSKGLAVATASNNKGNMVIMGGMNYDYYSKDQGKTWKLIPRLTNYSIFSVIYAEKIFVAGCDRGRIIYSKNGMRWREANIHPANHDYVWGVTYCNGNFYAVRSYSNRSHILVSEDGKTWKAKKVNLKNANGTLMNLLNITGAR